MRRTVPAVLAVVLGIVVLAEGLAATGALDPLTFPAPSRVLSAFADGVSSGIYSDHLAASGGRLLGGLAVAVGVGVPLGVVMGHVRAARMVVWPVLALLYPIPISLLIPLFIAVFGFTPGLYIALVALATGIPIVFSTTDAVAQVSTTLVETGRTLGLGRVANLRRVVVPAALPRIARGVFVALSIGILVLVTAEILSSSVGLGNVVIVAQRSYRIPEMYAGILLIGLVGLAATEGARRAAAWLARWEQSPASRSP